MPPNYSSYRKRGLNGQYRFDPDLTMSPQARGRAVRGSLGEKGYVHIVNLRVSLPLCFHNYTGKLCFIFLCNNCSSDSQGCGDKFVPENDAGSWAGSKLC